jgi:hypothetical protein
MTAEGFKSLGEGLKGSQVRAIDLGRNEMGPEVTKAFVEALRETQVRSLNLRHNQLGDEGLKMLGEALKGTRVDYIHLGENDFTAAGAKVFAQALKHTQVRTVSLEGADDRLMDDACAQAFVDGLKGTQVIKIDLAENNLTDEGIKALSISLKETQVISVNVAGIDITPEAMQVLSEALELNKKRYVDSPYVLASLKELSKIEKDKCWNKTVEDLETKEGEFIYGAGILMNEYIPDDIRQHIMGFLPLMESQTGQNQAFKYMKLVNERKNKLELIEVSEVNPEIKP